MNLSSPILEFTKKVLNLTGVPSGKSGLSSPRLPNGSWSENPSHFRGDFIWEIVFTPRPRGKSKYPLYERGSKSGVVPRFVSEVHAIVGTVGGVDSSL